MKTYSNEHIKYLNHERNNKIIINICRILIMFILIIIWEILAKFKIINTFLYSSPSIILSTIIKLIKNNNLWMHIFVTLKEVLISFSLSMIIGIIIASILWSNKFIAKVLDPYITIFNSLPKVSLGPLLIILIGANEKSIIVMALLITLFTTIINVYHGFLSTDKSKIILLKSLNASKYQIYKHLILRSNIHNIINTAKINISLSLIGVIMGELLVSKAGLGYLIMYGSQVFNLNLVITSIFVLGIFSYLLYFIISYIEKKF